MRVKMLPLNPKSWVSLDPDTPLPLQQFWAYGKALETFGGNSIQIEIIDESGEKVAMAVAVQRRFMGCISLTTIFRGPVWLQKIGAEEKTQAFRALLKQFPKLRWNFLALLPEYAVQDPELNSIKMAGYRRVMTGFSTAWLDLRPDEEIIRKTLKGKWRNQLKKAEASGLHIAVGGKKPHQYSWLLEREADQRDQRRYQATPLGLVPEYVNAAKAVGDMALSVIASYDKAKIAGALFLLHGNSATYHVGWAGDEARPLNAQNLVLWQGIIALKERGICFLDLGGLNTAELAGIARFKMGLGAEPYTLAGTYI